MENKIEIFNNEEFGEVRTLIINDEIWFVGRDVAKILGYGNGNVKSKALSNAISDHVEEEDKIKLNYAECKNLFRVYQNGDPTFKINSNGMIIINESGLYSLILQSSLPKAKDFKRWVTKEVLPTIRKTGSYIANSQLKIEELKTQAELKKAEAMLVSAQTQQFNSIMKVTESMNLSPVVMQSFGLKAIETVTGQDMGQYLPEVERTYSATEIGVMLGISAKKVGSIANTYGLKNDDNGVWCMDKAKHTGKTVSSFRYFVCVVDKIKDILEYDFN